MATLALFMSHWFRALRHKYLLDSIKKIKRTSLFSALIESSAPEVNEKASPFAIDLTAASLFPLCCGRIANPARLVTQYFFAFEGPL